MEPRRSRLYLTPLLSASVSCYRTCKPFHGLRLSVLNKENKETTYLLTYLSNYDNTPIMFGALNPCFIEAGYTLTCDLVADFKPKRIASA